MQKDTEFMLKVLKDGKPHSGEEIRTLSIVNRGVSLTVHSRAASLRDEGWMIQTGRIPKSRDYWYQLVGKKEKPTRVKNGKEQVVGGYIFQSAADVRLNGRICEIVRRADPDAETLEPAFWVRFVGGKDAGREQLAWGTELSPWYAS